MLPGMTQVQVLAGGRFRCTPAWGHRDDKGIEAHKVYFPIRGLASVAVDGLETEIRPGSVYFIPGYRRIASSCARSLDVDWLHFRTDQPVLNLRLAQVPNIVVWPATSWSFFKRAYTSLGTHFSATGPRQSHRIEAMLLWLIGELLEYHVTANAESAEALLRFAPALACMDAGFLRNPPLAEIAATVHLNPEYFHRTFSAAFRATPYAYMLTKRMALSAELLRESQLPIKEVAKRCGYANQLYFSRVVAKHYGCSPLQLRQQTILP
jgi:AraC family transcriptional regulator, arabinose operon regulatory protein